MKPRGRVSDFAPPAVGIGANVFVVTVFLSVGLSPALRVSADHAIARYLFIACAALAAGFSLIFSWYAATHFARRKRRETALRSLFGMRRRTAFLSLASAFAAASAAAGIIGFLTALALNRFFSLLLGVLTRRTEPLAMPVGPVTFVSTAALIGLGIATATVAIGVSLGKAGPAALFDSEVHHAAEGRRVRLKTLVGFSLIAAGYIGASQSDMRLAAILILPVFLAVVSGTFTLLAGLPILAATFFQTRFPEMEASFSLALSRFAFETKRGARSLALITVFVAVAVTSGGTMWALAANETIQIDRSCPNGLELTSTDTQSLSAVTRRINQIIKAEGHPDQGIASPPIFRQITVIPLELHFEKSGKTIAVEALPFSVWSGLLKETGRKTAPAPMENEIFGTSYFMTLPGVESSAKIIASANGGLALNGTFRILREGYARSSAVVLKQVVLSDAQWEKLSRQTPAQNHILSAVWNSDNPDYFRSFGASFHTALAEAEKSGIPWKLRIDAVDKYRMNAGALLFIGAMLTVSFLGVAISALAFKLWEGVPADRQCLTVLDAIGMRTRDKEKTIAFRIAFSFALPAALGTLHAAFALRMLATLSGFSVFLSAVAVSTIALLSFTLSARLVTRRYPRGVSTRP
ncbi:MAG: hypothetical protein WCT14_04125 [Treponemataceae bacterium]